MNLDHARRVLAHLEAQEKLICQRCFGSGKETISQRVKGDITFLPCRECGGSGQAHCCEGERAQPESGRKRQAGKQKGPQP